MLATCALLPVLAEDRFLSDSESDLEFISKTDSKMEDGKTTIFSMVTLSSKSARAVTKGKVNKELVEIVPVTPTPESTRGKADRKIMQNFTENTRKLPSLFYNTTSDSIVVRPRIVENRPWVRKPTRPLNLGKYSKLVAKRREQGIDIHIEVPKITFRICQ